MISTGYIKSRVIGPLTVTHWTSCAAWKAHGCHSRRSQSASLFPLSNCHLLSASLQHNTNYNAKFLKPPSNHHQTGPRTWRLISRNKNHNVSLSHHHLHCRLTCSRPHMLSHRTIPFPFAIVCHHTDYTEQLEALFASVNSINWTGMSPIQAAQILVNMDIVAAFPRTKWYPALVCGQPGIYSHL